jgi:excisionase family DNA binding protein
MRTAVPRGRDRPDADGEEYVTVPQAARLLKVSTPTVWRWIKAGMLPALRVGERSVRIKGSDLDRVVRPVQEGRGATEATGSGERPRPAILTGPRGPLSAEEAERRLAALERADASRAEQLARRGGKPYSSSTALVDEARAELSRR